MGFKLPNISLFSKSTKAPTPAPAPSVTSTSVASSVATNGVVSANPMNNNTCDTNLTNCNTSLETTTTKYNNCSNDLSTCNINLGTCNTNLGTCNTNLGTCNTNLGTCNTNLDKTTKSLNDCSLNLNDCSKNLTNQIATNINTIKFQNKSIYERINEIQDGYNVNDQKYYYLTLTRRYGAYIATLFVWLYWIVYIILLFALLNSTKFSKNGKIFFAVIMFLFPFYRAIYNITVMVWNFLVDMFIRG